MEQDILYKGYRINIRREVYPESPKDWDNIDSCWGYYGDPEESGIIEEAKSIIDNL